MRTRIRAVSLYRAFGGHRSRATILKLVERCSTTLRRSVEEDEEVKSRSARAGRRGRASWTSSGETGRGAVVCSIHMGPFCHLPAALMDRGFDLGVFTNSEAANAEASLAEFCRCWTGPGALHLLPASDPCSLLRAARCVRSGGLVFGFIEGNAGADGAAEDNRHLARFRFLSSETRARTGLAHLAATLGVPLLPALCRWERGAADGRVQGADPGRQPRPRRPGGRRREPVSRVRAPCLAGPGAMAVLALPLALLGDPAGGGGPGAARVEGHRGAAPAGLRPPGKAARTVWPIRSWWPSWRSGGPVSRRCWTEPT